MKDFLIVGHGIAGAVLSNLLIEKGKAIDVLDEPNKNISSMVAAGLYNPITGRRMVKTWMADSLFPSMLETYRRLEKVLSSQFLHDIGIYRPFVDIAEQNDWDAKRSDDKFAQFIEDVARDSVSEIDLNDPHGGLHLAQSGYLDIPALLLASSERLKALNSYSEENFEEDKLEIGDDTVFYKGTEYGRVIYCNGLRAQESKHFGWLPFRPVKGDVMIMSGEKDLKKIYNRGIFILPRKNREVKVGSTYQNHFESIEPTEKGQNELLEKLSALCHESFERKEALAGVRPATKDRRPLIGKHPEYGQFYLFNGFGSKGVSLVPYFAHDLLSHLIHGTEINEDVNLNRYLKEYSNPVNISR
ncbi:NAD(P)/FAD-dependent oxidoreductase [Reichenbachiella versicolor]|uniref:NAD(P)/FAD-dependent oxidoreductase n=1 Tax=Reichenbachiella versicolor TaxID=1821036 RepID=UPI0013A5338E|nr:FAD-dependent oxidoreductase [Reichenbachiella versicolor]